MDIWSFFICCKLTLPKYPLIKGNIKLKPTKFILTLLSLFLIFSCEKENSVEPLVCDEGLTDVDGVCSLVCGEGLTEV